MIAGIVLTVLGGGVLLWFAYSRSRRGESPLELLFDIGLEVVAGVVLLVAGVALILVG